MLCTLIGAGPGLGAAIADRFVAGGLDVALVSRAPDRMSAWLARRPDPERMRGFSADAADGASLAAAFAAIRAWRGETDVLVFHAADMSRDDVRELDADRLLASMRTTVGGALSGVTQVLPSMRRAGRGTILFTGGGLGLEPYPDWGSLGAGKAALRNLGLNLHKSLLPEGIHVAVVSICGVVEADGPFAPETVAEVYWQLHAQPLDRAQREVVYLPSGSDPAYNDPDGRFARGSEPIRSRMLGP